MRTYLLLAATALLSTTALHAQDKGFVSGVISYTSTGPSDGDATTDVVFGPAVGFNVNDHIVVGLGVNYGSHTVPHTATIGNAEVKLQDKTSLFTITPFGRYVKKVDDHFSIYGQLSFGIGFGSTDQENATIDGNAIIHTTTSTVDVNTFNVTAGPGIGYVLAPRWALTANWGALRYESESQKADVSGAEKFTTNTFGIAIDPAAISFSLNWLF